MKTSIKSLGTLAGAVVALLAGITTFVLIMFLNNEGLWQFLLWSVALVVCGVAVVASLGTVVVAVAAPRRTSGRGLNGGRTRDSGIERGGVSPGVPIDRGAESVDRYKAAVEMAWADRELNGAEKERLQALESEFGLGWEQAARVEREVMGATKEEIPPPENKAILQYRGAVEVAWADGRVNQAEVDKLHAARVELGLSREKAAEVERQVMGATKEEIVTPDDPPPDVPPPDVPPPDVPLPDGSLESSERYRVAVKMAWADKKLNEKEKDYLGSMIYELDLDGELAGSIERDIMGATRADIGRDGPDEDELLENEPWVGLVEDCVEVVDELDRHMTGFDSERKELADHMMLRMEEVLERAGVEVISDDETFDKRRHNTEKGSAGHAPGDAVAETLSPGFAVGRRVLRRARVRVE